MKFKKISDNHYVVYRYGTAISYIKRNTSTDEWYVGTIRQTLSLYELREIVDKMYELEGA